MALVPWWFGCTIGRRPDPGSFRARRMISLAIEKVFNEVD